MRKTIALVTILMCLSSVTCWWEVGHMTVTQIAEKRLTELG